jgi:hypothetical protein
MKKQTVVYSTVASVLFWVPLWPCLSQTRQRRMGPRPSEMRDMQRRSEQRRLENQRRREAHRKIAEEYRDEAHQEALGITAEQWAQIKPLLGRIDELRVGPMLKFSTYGFASGGSSSSVRSGSSGRSAGAVGGGGAGGWSGASGGSSSASYGFRTGSGPRPPRPGQSASRGGGSAGAGPEQPVKKRVGDLNLGWTWRRPSDDKGPDELTEADKICEGLLDAIEAETPERESVQKHIEQLRRIRREKQQELQQVRRALRAIATPEQEAKLILMGYLD